MIQRLDVLYLHFEIESGTRRMTKIDIVSGFLGAGKTTLIKKLLKGLERLAFMSRR